jgi:tRNA_anti-like
MKWLKRIAIAIVILGIAGFLVWKFVINAPNPNLKDKKADFTVSAIDLFKEISSGDTMVKTKYIDKIISITGNIKNIIPGDSTVINLGDTTSMSTIQCQIDPRNNEAAKALKENTMVTIKGKFAGIDGDISDPLMAELGTTIVLNFCTVDKK